MKCLDFVTGQYKFLENESLLKNIREGMIMNMVMAFKVMVSQD